MPYKHIRLLPQNPSGLQRNEVPYDADHVLKLDLEQEKLVQVMKLGLSVVRTRNDPLFEP